MIQHPFDRNRVGTIGEPWKRNQGYCTCGYKIGPCVCGGSYQLPGPFQPQRFTPPTSEEINEALSKFILPQLAEKIEGADNEAVLPEQGTPSVDVTELYEAACAEDDFDDEPVVFLTVDEALFVHEVLQAAFMGALIDLTESPSQLTTLGLQHLRGKIDEVQSVIEEQLEAAEAI